MITHALRTLLVTAAGATLAAVSPVSTMAAPQEDVVVVYDASGSMWGQIDGVTKVEIARSVMADLVDQWPDNLNLGLVVYGHRRAGDCADIETMITPAPVDRGQFLKTINSVRPKGKTPISASVQHAADLLSYRDNPATVILISDGVETCQADPCSLAADLAKQGVNFTAHVVGFDLQDEAHKSLACIAENTGGVFVPAQNAQELQTALTQIRTTVQEQTTARAQAAADPEPAAVAAPEAESEIAPDAEPEATSGPEHEISLQTPEHVITGARFAVAWSTAVHPRDYVTIVPVGAEESAYTDYARVDKKTETTLVAPAEPGLYEVRYVLDKDRRVQASAPIEVVEAEIAINAPESVTTGARFPVSWSSTANPRDYVTIVPVGAEESAYTDYARVDKKTEATLVAPAEPGLYEVRYILDNGRRVQASAPIEVVEASVAITAPDTARATSSIEVEWSGAVNGRDYITIVPVGSADKDYGAYFRVDNKHKQSMKAPEASGLYEIRYVLDHGRRVLARHEIEIVDADAPMDDGAGLQVPATAKAGSTLTISWGIAPSDDDRRIALARANQPDFSWISAQRVGSSNQMDLKMPDEPGFYEIRFLDIKQRAVLGRSIITVE